MSPLTAMRNPKAICVATLMLVFLAGGVIGALAMSLRAPRAPFWTESGKALYLERVKRELDLTPDQAEQMELILDDFSKYYRTVLSDGKSRILAILRPEQRQKFESMVEHERRRK
ncbi:MAG: hypothetical protein FJW37_03390 [Acidobacteria bacterium]|nr:hypothetical protein [Acidobacteriota bacterium]